MAALSLGTVLLQNDRYYGLWRRKEVCTTSVVRAGFEVQTSSSWLVYVYDAWFRIFFDDVKGFLDSRFLRRRQGYMHWSCYFDKKCARKGLLNELHITIVTSAVRQL